MPTPMTHAVVGASFSTALPQRLRGFRAAAVLGFLAMAPDLDIVGFYLGVPYSNTFGHRGFVAGWVVPVRADCRQTVSPTLKGSETGPEEPRLHD